MDFSNRGSQQTPATPRPNGSFPAEGTGSSKGSKISKFRSRKLIKIGAGVLLVAVAVLILATLALSILPGKSESSYVDSSKLQAVFLTNDQVYFGKIGELNSKTLVLSDIYYLRTQSDSTTQSTATNNSNVSLVKLGCELHKPFDRMVINREQVQFWENLQADGQVATAVKQYQSTNPTNTCSNTTSGAASTGNVQGSTAAPTTNTNSTTTTKP